MQRTPRDLSFLKCARCRKDRKKCTPLDRQWPGRRCDRCISFDYPCSGNLTAGGQSQRFAQVLGPVELNETNGYEWMGSFTPVPPTFSKYPLAAEFTTTKSSHTGPSPGESSNDAQTLPKSAELFSAVRGAGWSYPHQLKSSEYEPAGSPGHSTKLAISSLMKSSTTKFYSVLKTRENILKIYKKYLTWVEENIANGFPQRKAERITIGQMVLILSRFEDHDNGKSATDFVLDIVQMVREAGRWQQLIDAVSAPEILLIGQDTDAMLDAENAYYPGDQMLSAESLEKQFQKDHTSIDIANIMRNGGDDVFAKMKELILMPDLRLKETCQRLSGLLQLINHLGAVEGDFGLDDINLATNKEPATFRKNENSELISSLASDILRKIREVLRKPDPRCESEINEMASMLHSFMIFAIDQQIKECESETKGKGKRRLSNDSSSEGSGESIAEGLNQEFDDDFFKSTGLQKIEYCYFEQASLGYVLG